MSNLQSGRGLEVFDGFLFVEYIEHLVNMLNM